MERTLETPVSNGMPVPYRSQLQYDAQGISDDTATVPSDEIITRQEFGEEADVNNILARFGVNTQVRNDLQYGEVDYTIGLQEAINSVRAAQGVAAAVPKELRDKYPDWITLMRAVDSGEYARDLEELNKRKTTDEQRAKRDTTKAELRDQRQMQREMAAEDASNEVLQGRNTEQTPNS